MFKSLTSFSIFVNKHSVNSVFKLFKSEVNLLIISKQISIKKSTGRKTSRGSIKAPPPPKEIVTTDDILNAWVDVVDKPSGQVYYWNTITNETTALGAPKPTASSLAQPAPQQQTESLGSVMAQGI